MEHILSIPRRELPALSIFLINVVVSSYAFSLRHQMSNA